MGKKKKSLGNNSKDFPGVLGFPGGPREVKKGSKESAYNSGDQGSIPGSGRSPGEENGNPLQYSCLENPMDKGAWLAIVHRVTRVGHNLVIKSPRDF